MLDTCQSHCVQNSGVEDERQRICIDWLGAEGPHEGAVSEVQALWHNGRFGLITLQDVHRVDQIQLALALLIHGDPRYGHAAFYQGLLHAGRIKHLPSAM